MERGAKKFENHLYRDSNGLLAFPTIKVDAVKYSAIVPLSLFELMVPQGCVDHSLIYTSNMQALVQCQVGNQGFPLKVFAQLIDAYWESSKTNFHVRASP